MKILLMLLILINTILICFTVKRWCLYKGKIEINHVLFFSIGFFYYLLVPIIIGISQLFYNKPAMGLWYSIFNNVKIEILIVYIIIITIWYLSFIFGSKISDKKYLNIKERNFYFDKKVLNILWFLFLLLSLFFIYRFRNNFFQGYSNVENFNSSAKGPFVALSLMVFSLTIVYTAKLKNDELGNLNFRKVVFNKFFCLYIFVSILVLSLGGRLYFASNIMCLLVYYSVYFNKIKTRKFIFRFLVFVLIMGLLGVMRTGNLEGILDKALFNILQEPLYTSFSLIGFLEAEIFDIIQFPKFLLSEFINLFPTFLLPNKLDYILKPVDYGYTIFNPLGATNAFVSFMINFGFVGSIIVFFIIGLLMQRLKKRKNSIISKSIYILVSGFLTFTFFRDGFVTSIIKNIFQFSILTPIFIVLNAHFISVAVKGNSKYISN